MSNYTGGISSDPQVNRMRAARERAVVLKTDLANFRSVDESTFVFVFEGPDDPLVYKQWIGRIDDRMNYASMICNGKGPLLEFMMMMERDAYQAGQKILYFIDADFDGDRGYKSDKLFMTDSYSVENYLVNERVLDDTLQNEFYCALEPVVRKKVLSDFSKSYELFLAETYALNIRIYAARKLGIEIKKALPARISGIALIDYGNVSAGKSSVDELIVLEREPVRAEWDQLEKTFQNLDSRMAYRGKFAFLFFMRWLETLHAEYQDANSVVFRGCKRTLKARFSELGLGNFASKSSIPHGLANFLRLAV
ncbi:DUF4435 domain-containing protein [Methylorubrum extorquens]